MVKTSVVYKVETYNGQKLHLAVGEEMKTLCGETDITNVFVIPDSVEPDTDPKMNICSECKQKWDEMKSDVNRSPTIECHACNNPYPAKKARLVEHIDNGSVSVCRSCYRDMVNDASSGVTEKYEEAKSAF